jgi:hypothetical protein
MKIDSFSIEYRRREKFFIDDVKEYQVYDLEICVGQKLHFVKTVAKKT